MLGACPSNERHAPSRPASPAECLMFCAARTARRAYRSPFAYYSDGLLETIFHAQYKRMCRVIARVLRDPARAEELAVEVFLKWSRHPGAHGDATEGWLYRTALREALD